MVNKEALAEIDPDILTADGFDGAFIGVTVGIGECRTVYDSSKCVEVLMRDGSSYEDAVEYFEFNVAVAYVGERTPIFVDLDLGNTLIEPIPDPRSDQFVPSDLDDSGSDLWSLYLNAPTDL